ncbi:MAG: hypothetical protein ACOYNP_11340 [Gemmataceae bacterium]|nr:hypothetical protein [Planctomycetota bacterium]
MSTDWSFDGRVLAAEHLPRRLVGVTRVIVRPGTIVTPLAREDLSQRGISISHNVSVASSNDVSTYAGQLWIGKDRDYPFLGLGLRMAGSAPENTLAQSDPAALAAEAARWRQENAAGASVIFTCLPEMVAYEAGRLSGIPAAAVSAVHQAVRALATMQRPILAVEMPGRTPFEIRQILRLADPAGRAA